MNFHWIFKDFYHKSVDPISTNFVSISPAGTSSNPSSSLLKWDEKSTLWLQSNAPNLNIVTFTFAKPISFSRYRMQVLYPNRYMTGWRIDASYDGTNFTTINSKEENFCFKDYPHGNVIDCGEITTRSFKVPVTTAKKIRLVQTKADSCGTYCVHLSTFDIYGGSPELICFTHSKYRRNYLVCFICLVIYS